MREIVKYICEECESEYTKKLQAILCEQTHKRNKKLEDYGKRVVKVAEDMYCFKAKSHEDFTQCMDIYFEGCDWYSSEDYEYPCDLLIRITAEVYTGDSIAIVNRLSEILSRIDKVLNEEG